MSTMPPLDATKRHSTQHSELVLIRYHNLKMESPLVRNFEDWITSLNPAEDGGENGRGTGSSRNWLGLQDFQRPPGDPQFATYIHHQGGSVPISTVTLGQDDRNILVNNGIKAHGAWGLFVVQRNFRKKGFGTALAVAVDKLVQNYVNANEQPQDWITFSADPTAIKILSAVGFVHEGEVTIHQPGYNNGEPSVEQLHRRVYVPQG